VNQEEILMMNKIDELATKRPYFGSRRIADELAINPEKSTEINADNGA